mmetsp:Transcript_44550/g.131978  ORF Transcript_44550/g.131978 Transcript_44550/m.131978 type:complete len:84 (+) Transcript_44550:74-325(+)
MGATCCCPVKGEFDKQDLQVPRTMPQALGPLGASAQDMVKAVRGVAENVVVNLAGARRPQAVLPPAQDAAEHGAMEGFFVPGN